MKTEFEQNENEALNKTDVSKSLVHVLANFKNGNIQIFNDNNNTDLLLDIVNACKLNHKNQNTEFIINNSKNKFLYLLIGVNMNDRGISTSENNWKYLPIVNLSNICLSEC